MHHYNCSPHSEGGGVGPDVAGCFRLSHQGFDDNRRAMKEAQK